MTCNFSTERTGLQKQQQQQPPPLRRRQQQHWQTWTNINSTSRALLWFLQPLPVRAARASAQPDRIDPLALSWKEEPIDCVPLYRCSRMRLAASSLPSPSERQISSAPPVQTQLLTALICAPAVLLTALTVAATRARVCPNKTLCFHRWRRNQAQQRQTERPSERSCALHVYTSESHSL